MKKTRQYPVLLSLILFMFIASCGPSKKFVASEDRASRLQKENANKTTLLNECKLHVDNLNTEKSMLLKENAEYKDNLKFLSATSELTIADQASRLKNLQNIIQLQKDGMDNLKNSISNALMNYKNDELYIYQKNGKVYISLQEKLLFKSGSDVIDNKGKEALKSLAMVLNNTKDINIMIEGHTDNVPIKNQQYKDNWDLSTARATAIVRILVNNYNVAPETIIASGGGKYHPVNTNDNEMGRSGNRRTEVIVSPNLKELYDLFSSN